MAFSFRLPSLSFGRSGKAQNVMTGIDIGSELIKIAAIKHEKGKDPVLVTLAAAPTPPESVTSGEIMNPETLSTAVQALLAKHNIPTTRLALALGNKDVIVKRYDVKREDLPLLKERMQALAESDLPFEPSEASYWYQQLDKGATDGPQPVLLAAAQHSYTSQREELASTFGTLAVLDIDAYAIFNALAQRSPSLRGPAIHLHLGFDASNLLCIDAKGRLQAARDLPNSLGVLRDEYMRLTNADKASATAALGSSGFVTAQRNICKGWLDLFANDIQRIWAAEQTLGPINGRPLTVSGGGAAFTEIVSAISSSLGASSITRIDPLQRLEYSQNALKDDLKSDTAGEIGIVAIGLALRHDGLQAPQ